MPESVMDQIVLELKRSGTSYYPLRGELKTVKSSRPYTKSRPLHL